MKYLAKEITREAQLKSSFKIRANLCKSVAKRNKKEFYQFELIFATDKRR